MKCFYAMDNIVNIDNHYYFCSLYNNCLYRFDSNFVIEEYARLPYEYQQGYMEYSKIYYYDGKIVILPWLAQNIIVFDVETKEHRYVKLEENCRGLRYYMAVQKKNMFYLIPCESDHLAIFDIYKEKIVERIKMPGKEQDKALSWCNVSYNGDVITIPQVYDNKQILFDTNTHSLDYQKEAFLTVDGLCGICDSLSGRWYIPKSATKLFFQSNNHINIYSDFPAGYKAGDISFYKIIPIKDMVFLLPRDSNMLLAIKEDGSISCLNKISPDEENTMEKYMFYSNVWEVDEKKYCIESRSGDIYEIGEDYSLIPAAFTFNGSEENKMMIDADILAENPYHEQTISVTRFWLL